MPAPSAPADTSKGTIYFDVVPTDESTQANYAATARLVGLANYDGAFTYLAGDGVTYLGVKKVHRELSNAAGRIVFDDLPGNDKIVPAGSYWQVNQPDSEVSKAIELAAGTVINARDVVDDDFPTGGSFTPPRLFFTTSLVRVATTANITIATALNNGDTLDGVTLATGDRVLVKDQSAAATNGVYIVGVSPARSTDFNEWDEFPGTVIAVQFGTTNAGSLWRCTAATGGTLGTTAIPFSSFTDGSSTANITIGTSTITGGTSGRVLYHASDNTVGELATTGTGAVVLASAISGFGSGTVTSIPDGNTNEVYWTVDNRTTTPTFTFSLGDITPTSLYEVPNISSFLSAVTFKDGAVSIGNSDGLMASIDELGQIVGAVLSVGIAEATTFNGNAITTGSGRLTLSTFTLTASATGTVYSTGNPQTTISGNAGTATKWATARTVAITGDLTYNSGSLDGSANVTASGTLATVNTNVGSFTFSSITVNAKGLITAASSASLGTGVSTFLTTPTSANLAAVVTDETGSGALVFATSPTLVTPALGTPSSGTLTNATGLPISTGISGLGTNSATALAAGATDGGNSTADSGKLAVFTTLGGLKATASVQAFGTGSLPGGLISWNAGNTFFVQLKATTVTAYRDQVLPDADGTVITTGNLTGITGTGTLTSGATGAGFTIALTTSTVTGTLADARLSANVPLINAANSFSNATNAFLGGTFTTSWKSTTALATPSALSATQFTAFASTVSGAVIMGYGTTNDVTLMNRAGTVCLGVGPNTTAINIPGALTVGGDLNLPAGGNINYGPITTITRNGGTGALTISTNAGNIILSAGSGITAAAALTLSTTLAVTGASTLTGGIVGVITVSNATAGNVGQTVPSLVPVGSAVSLTTATAGNVTSISLTAGDWWVSANVNFTETIATATGRSAGISTTSATIPTDGSEGYCGVQSTLVTEINSIAFAWKRVNVSSTTTVYLCALANFSAGTVAAFGSLIALRASR